MLKRNFCINSTGGFVQAAWSPCITYCSLLIKASTKGHGSKSRLSLRIYSGTVKLRRAKAISNLHLACAAGEFGALSRMTEEEQLRKAIEDSLKSAEEDAATPPQPQTSVKEDEESLEGAVSKFFTL